MQNAAGRISLVPLLHAEISANAGQRACLPMAVLRDKQPGDDDAQMTSAFFLIGNPVLAQGY